MSESNPGRKIDYDTLAQAYDDAEWTWGSNQCSWQEHIARAVVAAYEQQMREQGVVAMRRDDIEWMVSWMAPEIDFMREDHRFDHAKAERFDRIRSALVAVPENTEGGTDG